MEQCENCARIAAMRDGTIRRAGPVDGKLTDRMKEYVIERLAGFDSPLAIVKSLKEEFGITIARQTIEQYDPTRGRSPAKKYREQFFAIRHEIVEGKAARGAARRGVRVRWLENMAIHAMAQGDYALADRLLGSIAREVGDRRSSGSEVRPNELEARPITDRDRAQALASLLAQVQAAEAHAIANGQPSEDPLQPGFARAEFEP
jgi:hypothetical protein